MRSSIPCLTFNVFSNKSNNCFKYIDINLGEEALGQCLLSATKLALDGKLHRISLFLF